MTSRYGRLSPSCASAPINSTNAPGSRRLNATSLNRIRHWFTRMHRKDINGLMLVRYRDGWCDVRQTIPNSAQLQVEQSPVA